MNRNNQELQTLLKNLDSIVDKIKHVLVSTKPAPSNKKENPLLLPKSNNPDLELILMKIKRYKKLRAETHDNNELEVASLIDILINAEKLVKKISQSSNVSEYAENGFFNKFTIISQEVIQLIA